jgi:hypothetical protein
MYAISTTGAVLAWAHTFPSLIAGFLRKTCCLCPALPALDGAPAPHLVQRPVDGLHLLAGKADTTSCFSLTVKIGRVKRHSFFDSF